MLEMPNPENTEEDKIEQFKEDMKREKDMSKKIMRLYKKEFDENLTDILLLKEEQFLNQITNGVSFLLENFYTSKCLSDNKLIEYLDEGMNNLRDQYNETFGLLNNFWENHQNNQKKKGASEEYLTDFRKHCFLAEDQVIHNCGNKSNKFLVVKGKNNKIKFVICESCKKVYFSTFIMSRCNKCNVDYYTSMLESDENKDLLLATWERYHCPKIVNEKMRCFKCRELLYINMKNGMLTCTNKNCGLISKPNKILWTCLVCKKEFKSGAIPFNPLELEAIKKVIRETLLQKHRAHPNRMPCCKLNVFFTKFYHKKQCQGVLYEGEINDKIIIVCDKCHGINYFERFIWTCPKCQKKFRDKKGILVNGEKNEEENEEDNEFNVFLQEGKNNNYLRNTAPLSEVKLFKSKFNRSRDFKLNNCKSCKDANKTQGESAFKPPFRGKRFELNNIKVDKKESIDKKNDENDNEEKGDSYKNLRYIKDKEEKNCNKCVNKKKVEFSKRFERKRSKTVTELEKERENNSYLEDEEKGEEPKENLRRSKRKYYKKFQEMKEKGERFETEPSKKENQNNNEEKEEDKEDKFNKTQRRLRSKLVMKSNPEKEEEKEPVGVIKKAKTKMYTREVEKKKNKVAFEERGKNEEKTKSQEEKEENNTKKKKKLFECKSSRYFKRPSVENNDDEEFDSLGEDNDDQSKTNSKKTNDDEKEKGRKSAIPSKKNNLIEIKESNKNENKTKVRDKYRRNWNGLKKELKNVNSAQEIDKKKFGQSDNNLIKVNKRMKFGLDKNENNNDEEEKDSNNKENVVSSEKPSSFQLNFPMNSMYGMTEKLMNHIQKRMAGILSKCKIPLFNIEEYIIDKKLGEGSYGIIFSVYKDDDPSHKYALKKIIARTLSEINNFTSEFQLVYSCNHPNIMKIYGLCIRILDSTTYSLYVLMEMSYSDWDKEIKQKLQKRKNYSEDELITILRQLVNAMMYMQTELNISHRDIKPQNILLFEGGLYKLADFGEAKEVKVSKQLNTLRGTELYMSPALYDGLKHERNDVSHDPFKSDVFSLGFCLLYAAALNFDLLYQVRGLTNSKTMNNVLNQNLRKTYSAKFCNILSHMLEIDESKRYNFVQLLDEINSGYQESNNKKEAQPISVIKRVRTKNK